MKRLIQRFRRLRPKHHAVIEAKPGRTILMVTMDDEVIGTVVLRQVTWSQDKGLSLEFTDYARWVEQFGEKR